MVEVTMKGKFFAVLVIGALGFGGYTAARSWLQGSANDSATLRATVVELQQQLKELRQQQAQQPDVNVQVVPVTVETPAESSVEPQTATPVPGTKRADAAEVLPASAAFVAAVPEVPETAPVPMTATPAQAATPAVAAPAPAPEDVEYTWGTITIVPPDKVPFRELLGSGYFGYDFSWAPELQKTTVRVDSHNKKRTQELWSATAKVVGDDRVFGVGGDRVLIANDINLQGGTDSINGKPFVTKKGQEKVAMPGHGVFVTYGPHAKDRNGKLTKVAWNIVYIFHDSTETEPVKVRQAPDVWNLKLLLAPTNNRFGGLDDKNQSQLTEEEKAEKYQRILEEEMEHGASYDADAYFGIIVIPKGGMIGDPIADAAKLRKEGGFHSRSASFPFDPVYKGQTVKQ
jgi:hypothetical protein